jgi:ankyrin repeat protein
MCGSLNELTDSMVHAVQSEVLELLLAYEGIQVTMENEDGNTPLHYFCRSFPSPTCQALLRVLLSLGADPNKPNQVPCPACAVYGVWRVACAVVRWCGGASLKLRCADSQERHPCTRQF